MNRAFVTCLLIGQVLCFISCTHADHDNLQFSRDIPKGKDSILFDRLKQTRDYIRGLDTLENGYNSIQIRIWFGYVFLDSAQIFVIKKNSQKQWSGELWTIVYGRERDDSLIISQKLLQKIAPVSGWDNTLKTLNDLGIQTLPDSREIKNYPDATDGDGTTIEVATQKLYRVYFYGSVDIAQATIKEARKVEQIETFIQNEFQFKKLR